MDYSRVARIEFSAGLTPPRGIGLSHGSPYSTMQAPPTRMLTDSMVAILVLTNSFSLQRTSVGLLSTSYFTTDLTTLVYGVPW